MPSYRWPLVVAFAIALAVMAHALDARSDGPLEAMRLDAQLADVFFVDAECGWAVGDRGVIWHTTDGGKHWVQQNSSVNARLASVFFLDANTGWAAGGTTQPYSHATSGMVLRTQDGGQHWSQTRHSSLPAIERIRFFDPTHGWAFGRTSSFFPSGVFATEDGGRSWSALPAEETGSWLAGDLINRDTGALAGRSSALAMVRHRGIEPLAADFGLRALRRMKLIEPAEGWLVGEGGLVLKTADLGKSWQTTDGELPAALRNGFDFTALEARGDHCWVAGTPGTRVLRTTDGGRTWKLGDTSQSLPIHALAFSDEQRGWAVGDLGTILATTDGGQTWRKQQGGGARAAMLGFYGRADEIPLELLARLSAEDGYLAAVEVLGREDIEARASDATDPALVAHEAAVIAGASAVETAWRFPLRQTALRLSAEQLVEGWDRANDSGALEKLETHLVARIRMWRPNVVFTSSSDPSGGDPLAHVVNQIVLQAVEHASDATRCAELTEIGLKPWHVQKVYVTLPPGQNGTANVNTSQLVARLGRTIAEWAAPARGVLAKDYAPPGTTVGFRLMVDHIPQEAGKRDFFSGIAISPGGEARRRFDDPPEQSLDAMRRDAQMRRNLQAILARAEIDDREGRFLADIGGQTRGMQSDRAAELLFQLAQRYFSHGHWELAAECYDLIVERYSDQPLAGPALRWLVQYYASSEAAWRTRQSQQIKVESTAARPPNLKAAPEKSNSAERATLNGAPVEKSGAAITAAHIERSGGLIDNMRPADSTRAAKADGYAKQLERLQPALFAEPNLRFALAAAHRQQGLPRQAERYFQALRHSRPQDAWWACAQSELWLGEPKGQPPKPLWKCTRATTKPKLNGRLDESVWQSGNSVELRSAQRDDVSWRAVAMLAYDEEFLYLSISCSHAPGLKYAASNQPRPRDPDLADCDRVELFIDVDRDFATYYHLVVDSRGWTGDRALGDKTWDPNWFVASAQLDGAWTAEAAIPLSELTGDRPTEKRAWAVGVQRIVPGVGFQSWTTPAAAETIPEGFGILIFQ